MLQSQENFRTETKTLNGHLVLLELIGELDLYTMPTFESALEEALSDGPRVLVVNALRANFLSVQAFWAIGHASTEVEQLRFQASSGFARRIFNLIGYGCSSRGSEEQHKTNRLRGEKAAGMSEWLVVGTPALALTPKLRDLAGEASIQP